MRHLYAERRRQLQRLKKGRLRGAGVRTRRRQVEPGSDLAAKIEFSYGAGQTVNLLALRLQWFESTPAQAFV